MKSFWVFVLLSISMVILYILANDAFMTTVFFDETITEYTPYDVLMTFAIFGSLFLVVGYYFTIHGNHLNREQQYENYQYWIQLSMIVFGSLVSILYFIYTINYVITEHQVIDDMMLSVGAILWFLLETIFFGYNLFKKI